MQLAMYHPSTGLRTRELVKNRMAPNIPLAIVLLAAVVTVALRAAARRPEPQRMPGTEPAPITVTDHESPGPPVSVVEQMQHVFHELHADGRHAHCTVCESQYRSA